MKSLILSLILINFILYYLIFDFLNQKKLVAFLDIGQGNSVLIKNKKNIYLYDTGKYPSYLFQQLDKFIPFYNRKIDVMFLSHPDNDHYFAAIKLLEKYKVRLIVVSNFVEEKDFNKNLLEQIKKFKIPVIKLQKGNRIVDNHFKIYILHPSKNYQNDNNESLVIKIVGKNSYLLTGDIEKEAINDLINCCSDILVVDYFLVPHHGSRYSLNENFYKKVNPKFSIFQVGENYYGHPHKEVIDFLSQISKIWRTDLNKTLIIRE
jgi:competence protein ComEC